MERADRAAIATFHAPGVASAAGRITLGEDSAHHARVRRLAVGESVRLTDGEGTLAIGRIERLAKGSMELALDEGSLRRVARPTPVHLLVPVGDRDRMLWLAEKSAELGVTTWVPVLWTRSRSVSPRGEGEAFMDKVERRMAAALEQSAGAWLPRVEREVAPDVAAARFGEARRVLLDAHGAPLPPMLAGADAVAIALGPEGGLDESELALLRDAGWRSAALAPSVLRFETAAIAAVAVARASSLERGAGSEGSTGGR